MLEFPLACGITVGTPVRIRGVPVGSVLSVNPSLEKVEVLVEVTRAPPPLLAPVHALFRSACCYTITVEQTLNRLSQ